MPIYEYKCTKCGEVFETIQKFSDKPLKNCKFCNGRVERLISNTSFQLKGSGWYLTDYARKASSPEGADKGSDKTKDASTAKKTEKAPADKSKDGGSKD